MGKYGEGKYGTGKFGAFRTFQANIKSSAGISHGLLFFRELLVKIGASANVSRAVLYVRQLTTIVSTRVDVLRSISKNITARVTAISSVSKEARRQLTTLVSARVNTVRRISKDITARVTAALSVTKRIGKAVSALIGVWSKAFRYRPVFPRLSHTEYPVELAHTEHLILMEVSGLAIAGSTITLKGTFPDSAGNLTLLENIVCKVYSPGKVLAATITPTQVSTGAYTANYTIPADGIGQYDYEFTGNIGNITIAGRTSFDARWR